MLNIFESFANKWKLRFEAKKLCALAYSRRRKAPLIIQFRLGEYKIHFSKTHVYLGVI